MATRNEEPLLPPQLLAQDMNNVLKW